MLTAEQERIVSEYESKLKELDGAIAKLQEKRDLLIETHDEDYAGYLDHYTAYYDDEPLSMRAYYEAINEWRELMSRYNAINSKLDHNNPEEDYSEMERFEAETNERFRYLERILGA